MTYHQNPVNIGLRGRKHRIILGLATLFLSLGAFAWMFVVGLDSIWRWALFLPLFGGILCVVEAKSSTCVVLAALGAWDLGCGTQKVPDRGLETDLRMRAIKIIGLSLAAALAITSLLVFVPCRGDCSTSPAPVQAQADSGRW